MSRITTLASLALLLFACEGGPIWTKDSRSIEIRWFSFWEGGYRFERDAEEMSAQQLRLAREIQTISGGEGCAEDAAEASVFVTDKAGMRREYLALSRPCAQDDATLVDYEQVEALLRTASCLSAKGATGTGSLATAPHISVGDGCAHGLFSWAKSVDYWMLVDVEDPGPHRFAVEACFTRVLHLELFDESGDAMLAKAQPSAGECPVLDYEFDEAGTYALRVVLVSSMTGGDFFLTANRRP